MYKPDKSIIYAQNKRIKELKEYEKSGKYHIVLLITSYCSDNPDCTNAYPCEDCVQISNIAVIKKEHIYDVVCGYDFLKERRNDFQEEKIITI